MWKPPSALGQPKNALEQYESSRSGYGLGLGVVTIIIVGLLFAFMSNFGAPQTIPNTVPRVGQ